MCVELSVIFKKRSTEIVDFLHAPPVWWSATHRALTWRECTSRRMLNFEGIEEDWRRKSVSQMLFKTRLLIVAYLCEKLLRDIFTKCEKLDEDFIPPHHSFDVLSGKFYLWHVAVHARDEIYELAILMWIVGEKYFFANDDNNISVFPSFSEGFL